MALIGTCRIDPDPAPAAPAIVYVIAEFRNFGVLYNPPTLTVVVLSPNGVPTTFSNPTNGVDGVQDTTQVGKWWLAIDPIEGENSVSWYTQGFAIPGAQVRFTAKRPLLS